ncbi:hypothetical protein AHMF7605_28765 [Adhaeribacter arboris]|uniref:DAPG hydrolase PhiG domain-containing protein n=1 Tax=Adhaeribacter arboris TaxID=2072846 RepID=A0A2T2Y8S1_9BACT|nr:hypothetical protein [Adhaeribacter arboris]PSR51904.1 hypothetical protein AHMF7605_28765 [Adhaeribacter arboris]
MKWRLPDSRDFGWKMKSVDSAHTKFSILPYSSYELCIQHDTIRNVTPVMLEWWFKNIKGTMDYQGKTYSKYLVWHPIDHIHWELARTSPNGSAGIGAQFRIVEAFGGDLNQLVDSTEEVVKLDFTGLKLIRKILGIEVFSLEHQFIPVSNGTRYISRMQVGAESFIGKYFINPLLHTQVFTKQMGTSWLKHNVEEVGNFEFFLPKLYASYLSVSELEKSIA